MTKVEILQQKEHNFLWIDDKLIMWDLPQEKKDQQRLAKQAFGKVLVAGYGLGLVQEYLIQNRDVHSVLTVELHKEVIEECRRIYGKIFGDVVIGDFFDFNPNQEKFNCVIGDTWENVGQESLEDYVRFKEKAKTLLTEPSKILAWGGDYLEYLANRSISRQTLKEIDRNAGIDIVIEAYVRKGQENTCWALPIS